MNQPELRDRLDEAGKEMGVSIDHARWAGILSGFLWNPNFGGPGSKASDSRLIPNREPDQYTLKGKPVYELGGEEGGVLIVKSDSKLRFQREL